MPYTNSTDPQGNRKVSFANGTTLTIFAPLPTTATLYDIATRATWNRTFSNGTYETKFNNGTHIRVEIIGPDVIVFYIKKVEGEAIVKEGDKIIVKFQNNSTRTYFPPLPETATEFERMVAPNYTDSFANGTSFIKYFNGSLATT